MKTWIVLPYDGSPLARAALRHAARIEDAGVILATAGVDPAALEGLLAEAQAVAGPDVPLEVRLLNAGDPIGDLHQLAASLPEAVLAAPMGMRGVKGGAPWYAEAIRIGGLDHTSVLFFITPEEIKEFEEEDNGRHRVGSPLTRLLRAGAGLRLGKRSPVTRGAA